MENIENNESQPYVDPNEIKRPTSFLKWIENFWYHYKWHTIVVTFFAVLIIALIVQISGKEKHDVKIAFSGDLNVDIENAELLVSLPGALENITKAFEQLIDEDYNGDGKKNAITYGERLISPERQKELTEAAKDKSIKNNEHWVFMYNTSDYQTSVEKLKSLLVTGEAIICLMDSHSYELFHQDAMFARLEDVLGYLPEEAIDEYSVNLKDTQFGKFFEKNFDILPDDTRICIRTKAQMKTDKNFDEIYAANVDVFKKVFAFTADS